MLYSYIIVCKAIVFVINLSSWPSVAEVLHIILQLTDNLLLLTLYKQGFLVLNRQVQNFMAQTLLGIFKLQLLKKYKDIIDLKHQSDEISVAGPPVQPTPGRCIK